MKLNVNGVNLYYELHGEGKPLVLISGFSSDTSFWRPILQSLANHFKVLIFDNRGVGRSESPDVPYHIEDMAKDVICLMQELGLKNPHILGHSMGGAIAQTIAYKHGDLIDKLIISNSLIKINLLGKLMKNTIVNKRKDNGDQKQILEAKIPWLFSKDFRENEKRVQELTDFELTHRHPQSLVGFIRQLEALYTFDSSNWHHKIPHTTLVIGSDEDRLCSKDTETLSKSIPNAHFVNFLRVGHAPSIEKPAEFNQAIFEFLNRV
jgi:3-oxoadipate enol-lactonase